MNRIRSKPIVPLIVGLALCLIIGMLLAASRTPEAAPTKRVELEFFQQREEAVHAFSAVLSRFEEANPEVSIAQNNTANALALLSARIVQGRVPDLFTHWPTQLGFQTAVTSGKVQALDGQPFLDRIDPEALELCRKNGNGSIYALPINRNCVEVYYNTEQFAAMGLEIPTTTAELIAVCDVLLENGVTPFTFYIRDSRTAHIFQAVLAATNEDYLTRLSMLADGTLSETDEAQMLSSFRLVRELYIRYSDPASAFSFYEACENFAKGGSAMMISGSYSLSLLRSLNPTFAMGVFIFPGQNAENPVLLCSIDTAVCLSADCTDSEAALRLMDFLTQPENAQVYTALDCAPTCILGVTQVDPIAAAMEQHITQFRKAEWIKSRFSLEQCIAFETAVSTYMISGDVTALHDGLVEAFHGELVTNR